MGLSRSIARSGSGVATKSNEHDVEAILRRSQKPAGDIVIIISAGFKSWLSSLRKPKIPESIANIPGKDTQIFRSRYERRLSEKKIIRRRWRHDSLSLSLKDF
ncbi:unnamed protein product [Cochlearia groenlandica]